MTRGSQAAEGKQVTAAVTVRELIRLSKNPAQKPAKSLEGVEPSDHYR